jgi:DHA2 family multidrug resistance protein
VSTPADSRWLLTASTVLATLLYTVDSTIVNVALPHMQGSLQATQDQIAWVVTSYLVMSAISTPLAGWLGARYGLRRVLLVSVAGFTAGSMLCGIAENLTEMVGFRVIQGTFGAALVPLSQIALLQEFPRRLHGRVTALWGMGVLVGPIIGPTLGGWLTDELSWRWAFYINAPIGFVAGLGILASMARDHVDQSRPFDRLGFVLLSLSIALFQLMLDRGQTLDWFESTEILAEGFFAGVTLFMFTAHILTTNHPFVDPQLFRDRNFTASLGLMLATALSIMSPAILLPTFLQTLQGYSPTQSGELLAVRGAASIVAMLLAGRLVGRIDMRLTMAIGIVAAAASLWLMGGFTLDTPALRVAVAGVVQGFGSPFTFVPLSVVAYATLRPAQRAEAGALLTLVRNIFSSVGISLTVAALARSTQMNSSYLAEHFTAYSAERWRAIGSMPGPNAATAEILTQINRQAAAIGYANVFHWLAALTLATLPLLLLLKVDPAEYRH